MSADIKAGDYVVAKDSVYLLIQCVVQGSVPIYGFTNCKHPEHLHWFTQKQLDDQGYKVATPPFEQFNALKEGDVLYQGHGNSYTHVLARVDNAVLLSETPDENAGFVADMFEHMDSEHGIKVVPVTIRKQIKDRGSITKAHALAGDWFDVRHIYLMNWAIVKE